MRLEIGGNSNPAQIKIPESVILLQVNSTRQQDASRTV